METKIKYLISIIIFLLVLGCNKSKDNSKSFTNVPTLDTIKIVYYKLNTPTNTEFIKVKKEKTSQFLKSIYYYKSLQKENDTLTISENSFFFNSERLGFLYHKKYNSNGKSIVLKKFVGHGLYSSLNYYFNAKDELVLTRSLSDIVVEYYNPDDPSEIHSLIKKDSLFFMPEY